jgi:phosphate transport system substrate-binding protein
MAQRHGAASVSFFIPLVLFVSMECVLQLTLSNTLALAQQKILIDGSTGTSPLVEALGKAFTAKSNVTVEIGKGLGTKARFEALSAGKIDIAMASHGLKVSDITVAGMTVHRVASTPVVFGVHETVKIDGLAGAQICAIYEGKTTNWKDFGGADLEIAPHARPESEVDAEIVRDGIGCFKSLKLAASVKLEARASDMAKALAETAGAIGMTSTTLVERSAGKIKAVALDGVVANEASVRDGRYRLVRDAFLVTRNGPSADVKAFIDFVKGVDGAKVISENGAIPAAQ